MALPVTTSFVFFSNSTQTSSFKFHTTTHGLEHLPLNRMRTRSPPLPVRGLLVAFTSAAVLTALRAHWRNWSRRKLQHCQLGAPKKARQLQRRRRVEFAPRTVVRASLDIGSGQHKLCIAEVDLDTNAIVRVLHAEQKQVMLKHALLQATDGCLPDAVLAASYAVLAGFRERALAAGATQTAGVATAVFRRAINGEDFLGKVNGTLGLRLRIVSQRLEGELGYLAASSSLPPSPSCASLLCEAGSAPLLAWDSGGGSFQVSGRVGGNLQVWEGPIGDSDVTSMLLQIQVEFTPAAAAPPAISAPPCTRA